jgi:hypothetical protein
VGFIYIRDIDWRQDTVSFATFMELVAGHCTIVICSRYTVQCPTKNLVLYNESAAFRS